MAAAEEYLSKNRSRIVDVVRSYEEQKKRTYSGDIAMVKLLTAVITVLTGVTGLGITDQPKLDIGAYSRRSVRVSLPVVELRPLIEMLADIENSSYPVSIERIQMTGGRMRTGYTVKLAVNAYDREGPPAAEQE